MTEEYKRQTNELFYNVTHRGSKVSEASLTELLAMQKGLEAFIEEKKEQEFRVRVNQLKAMMEQFKKDFPCASWYVSIDTDDGLWETDLFDHMDYSCIEP